MDGAPGREPRWPHSPKMATPCERRTCRIARPGVKMAKMATPYGRRRRRIPRPGAKMAKMAKMATPGYDTPGNDETVQERLLT